MKAIETLYAGCRFRSRLEARWAVFFDQLGIGWEYELQGYLIGNPYGAQRPYLPDFYLPDLGQWAEVKGKPMDDHEYWLVANAAVPHDGWGLPGEGSILLLGGIPHVMSGVVAFHPIFHFHKGDLYRSLFWFDSVIPGCGDEFGQWLVATGIDSHFDPSTAPPTARNPSPVLMDAETAGIYDDSAVRAACTAARSARFEHGQSGAR